MEPEAKTLIDGIFEATAELEIKRIDLALPVMFKGSASTTIRGADCEDIIVQPVQGLCLVKPIGRKEALLIPFDNVKAIVFEEPAPVTTVSAPTDIGADAIEPPHPPVEDAVVLVKDEATGKIVEQPKSRLDKLKK